MIQNREVFLRDPLEFAILNEGRTSVDNPTTKAQWEVLRYELRNFVCEGEYRDGLYRILSTYLEHLARPIQPAVWVSGFYGSGKSHLVRMLEFLWRDVRFPDGAGARGLVDLPPDVEELLQQLDAAGLQRGGLWSAAGQLSTTTGSIRLALLRIVCSRAELPAVYPVAKFVIWAKQQGIYDALKAEVEKSGKTFDGELKSLYVSPILIESLLRVYPNVASSPAELRPMLREQFPRVEEIGEDEMLSTLNDILMLQSTSAGEIPCTLLVFDELQQTIGDDGQRSLQVQNIVEACSARFGSNLLFIGTGQSALEAGRNLSKLKDRFTVRVELSDKDVEQVVREVVLQKQPSRIGDVDRVLDRARGEIDRHLAGSRIGANQADVPELVPDYPLLPTRRRFWERVLRAIDNAGTSAQLRTQLRIVHEATRQVANAPLGTVVPGDVVYEQQKGAMLQNGTLLREMEVIIQEQDDGTPNGQLRSRLCATIFLINQLPQEGVLATAISATADTLADLLVTDLNQGSADLRQRIPTQLEKLTEDGILMQVEGEYRLQTRESAEWQQDFRLRHGRIADDTGRIESNRNKAFQSALDRLFKPLRLTQGTSKVERRFSFHFFMQDAPTTDGDTIPVWVQSGWDTPERQVRDASQAAGTDSPTVYVYIPRLEADALKGALARREAAQEVLNARPQNPTSSEAMEARQAMETRRKLAEAEVTALVSAILKNAKVYQGGGGEIVGETAADAVKQAAENAMIRLFPNFSAAADDVRWAQVVRRSSEGGGADVLTALSYNGEITQHPICKEVLGFIGSGGKRGNEVQRHYMGAGYGWPKDTVDGALMALLSANVVRATKNSQPVAAKGLSQGQIGVLDFVAEDEVLSVAQRIQIRSFLRDMGFSANSGEEVTEAVRLLNSLQEMALAASGDAPLPAKPNAELIDALQVRQGNSLLKGVYESRGALEAFRDRCQALQKRKQERIPQWQRLQQLLAQAGDLAVTATINEQIAAVTAQRSLLEDPDPVTPLLNQLSDALRQAVRDARQQVVEAREREVKSLAQTPEWTELKDETWQQILRDKGLGPVFDPDVSTDDALLQALRQRPLSVWDSEASAMPVRLQAAREAAAKRLDPGAVRIDPPSATLKTEADVDAYLDSLREQVMKYIARGKPVIL